MSDGGSLALPARMVEHDEQPSGEPSSDRNVLVRNDGVAVPRMINELGDRLVAGARAQTESLRMLSAARRMNHQLQDAFQALERHLPDDANRLDLVFADEQAATPEDMTLTWNGGGLRQLLPVSNLGVSAIELLVGEIVPTDGAVLRIHLCSAADQTVIDRWTLPLDQLSPGWAILSLSQQAVGEPKMLELRLNLEASQGARVRIGLGHSRMPALFHLGDPTKETATRHGAALRIWAGPTEASYAVGVSALTADASEYDTPGQVIVPVAPALVAAARHANEGETKFDFPAVSSIANQIAIQCHPPARGMTIAELKLAPGARPLSVSADTYLAHQQSRPVEFAIALADDFEAARAIFEGKATQAHEGFSGWQAVSPGERGSVTATVVSPSGRGKSAWCATRMQAHGNNYFGWARFRSFAMRIAAS